jgi:hypothetical protein
MKHKMILKFETQNDIDIVTAVIMKSAVFSNVTPCSLVQVYMFGRIVLSPSSGSKSRSWCCSLLASSTFFFCFLGWGETESTWYCGHCLAYCTSPR